MLIGDCGRLPLWEAVYEGALAVVEDGRIRPALVPDVAAEPAVEALLIGASSHSPGAQDGAGLSQADGFQLIAGARGRQVAFPGRSDL